MYAGSPNTRYLAPLARGEDVIRPLERPAETPPAGGTTVYIFLPERERELAWVQASHPEGSLREFRTPTGTLLFAVYEPD